MKIKTTMPPQYKVRMGTDRWLSFSLRQAGGLTKCTVLLMLLGQKYLPLKVPIVATDEGPEDSPLDQPSFMRLAKETLACADGGADIRQPKSQIGPVFRRGFGRQATDVETGTSSDCMGGEGDSSIAHIIFAPLPLW